MWGKIIIPMYRLRLHGLYGTRSPLSPNRLSLSSLLFSSLLFSSLLFRSPPPPPLPLPLPLDYIQNWLDFGYTLLTAMETMRHTSCTWFLSYFLIVASSFINTTCLSVRLSATLLGAKSRVFTQISLNLPKTFTSWDEATYICITFSK